MSDLTQGSYPNLNANGGNTNTANSGTANGGSVETMKDRVTSSKVRQTLHSGMCLSQAARRHILSTIDQVQRIHTLIARSHNASFIADGLFTGFNLLHIVNSLTQPQTLSQPWTPLPTTQ